MKRIIAIDILRGYALLGIFLMNIMSFAMPSTAYSSPAEFGGNDLLNRATYALVHIFADQKFMALFSMLFGASMMLLLTSFRTKGLNATRFHYTRNLWLLAIGGAHTVLLWDGDILMVYALCAFVLYFLRNIAPKWQFVIGLFVFLLPGIGYIAGGLDISGMSPAELASLENYWQTSEADITAEIAYYRGDYRPQLLDRLGLGEDGTSAASEFDLYYSLFTIDFFARAFGMMLIGMALYTWGILTAQASDHFYRKLLTIALPSGVLLAAVGVYWNSSVDWHVSQTISFGLVPNLVATPLIASGYIGLIMLWSRTSRWEGLQTRLAATGRMALTNYIAQSLLGTFIFYGFGLGLFGSLNRIMLLPIVLAVWALQLWLSPLWLRHYRYGPLEWLWRSLSYWQIQPLRRS